jgi:hypothetical protein
MKRIHKPACPAADDAVRHSVIMHHSGFLCLFAAISGDGRWVKRRREDFVRGRLDGGTLIHNGNCRHPSSIGLLTVPLVESPFKSAPMTEICSSTLLPPRFAPAMVTAILLAPVTPAADPEYGAAPLCPAKPLPESVFSRVPHSHPKARLDNGCRSWQLNGGSVDTLSTERYRQWIPVGDTTGISSTRPSAQDYTKMMMGAAPAARMMLWLSIPAGVQKNTFSDDR